VSHFAIERLSVEAAAEKLPQSERWVGAILGRVEPLLPPGESRAALDVGAAQGRSLIALRRRGYRAYGVEPWSEAIEVARQLAEREGCEIDIRAGTAEAIPFEDESFDLVIATSVIEHVENLQASLAEIFRVLRPGGVFWFNAASAVSPRQEEIARFPLFGWYPDRLKYRIMMWAKDHAPQLIGHTQRPALHWFTPRKARRELRAAGFDEVWDRWELRRLDEETGLRRSLLRLLRGIPILKLAADVAISGCSFGARKRGDDPAAGAARS